MISEKFFLNKIIIIIIIIILKHNRVISAKWVKKIESTNQATAKKTRNHVLQLLLMSLLRKRLVGPFETAPKDEKELLSYKWSYQPHDIARLILEKEFETIGMPEIQIELSGDLCEYLAYQPIPSFGTHFYYAYSPEKIREWANLDKEVIPKGLLNITVMSLPDMKNPAKKKNNKNEPQDQSEFLDKSVLDKTGKFKEKFVAEQPDVEIRIPIQALDQGLASGVLRVDDLDPACGEGRTDNREAQVEKVTMTRNKKKVVNKRKTKRAEKKDERALQDLELEAAKKEAEKAREEILAKMPARLRKRLEKSAKKAKKDEICGPNIFEHGPIKTPAGTVTGVKGVKIRKSVQEAKKRTKMWKPEEFGLDPNCVFRPAHEVIDKLQYGDQSPEKRSPSKRRSSSEKRLSSEKRTTPKKESMSERSSDQDIKDSFEKSWIKYRQERENQPKSQPQSPEGKKELKKKLERLKNQQPTAPTITDVDVEIQPEQVVFERFLYSEFPDESQEVSILEDNEMELDDVFGEDQIAEVDVLPRPESIAQLERAEILDESQMQIDDMFDEIEDPNLAFGDGVYGADEREDSCPFNKSLYVDPNNTPPLTDSMYMKVLDKKMENLERSRRQEQGQCDQPDQPDQPHQSEGSIFNVTTNSQRTRSSYESDGSSAQLKRRIAMNFGIDPYAIPDENLEDFDDSCGVVDEDGRFLNPNLSAEQNLNIERQRKRGQPIRLKQTEAAILKGVIGTVRFHDIVNRQRRRQNLPPLPLTNADLRFPILPERIEEGQNLYGNIISNQQLQDVIDRITNEAQPMFDNILPDHQLQEIGPRIIDEDIDGTYLADPLIQSPRAKPPRKYSFGSDDVSPDKPKVITRRRIANKFNVDPDDIELDEDLEDVCQPPLAPHSPRRVPCQALLDKLKRPVQTMDRRGPALPRVEQRGFLQDEQIESCDEGVTPEKKRPVYGPSNRLIDISQEDADYEGTMDNLNQIFAGQYNAANSRVHERAEISHHSSADLIEFVSPQRECVSPQQDVVSPQQDVVCPQREVVSPQREVISPQREVISPQREVISPQREVISPQREVAERMHDSSPGMACAMAEEPHASVDNRQEIQQSPSELDADRAWNLTERHYELVQKYEDFKKKKAEQNKPPPVRRALFTEPGTPKRKYSFGSPDKPGVPDDMGDENLEDECQPDLAPESPRLVPRQALLDALTSRKSTPKTTPKKITPKKTTPRTPGFAQVDDQLPQEDIEDEQELPGYRSPEPGTSSPFYRPGSPSTPQGPHRRNEPQLPKRSSTNKRASPEVPNFAERAERSFECVERNSVSDSFDRSWQKRQQAQCQGAEGGDLSPRAPRPPLARDIFEEPLVPIPAIQPPPPPPSPRTARAMNLFPNLLQPEGASSCVTRERLFQGIVGTVRFHDLLNRVRALNGQNPISFEEVQGDLPFFAQFIEEDERMLDPAVPIRHFVEPRHLVDNVDEDIDGANLAAPLIQSPGPRVRTPPPNRKYSFGSDDVSPDKPAVVRRRHIYNRFQVDPADIELDEDLEDECQPPLPYTSPHSAPRQALLDRLKRPVQTIDRRVPASPREEHRVVPQSPRPGPSTDRRVPALPRVEQSPRQARIDKLKRHGQTMDRRVPALPRVEHRVVPQSPRPGPSTDRRVPALPRVEHRGLPQSPRQARIDKLKRPVQTMDRRALPRVEERGLLVDEPIPWDDASSEEEPPTNCDQLPGPSADLDQADKDIASLDNFIANMRNPFQEDIAEPPIDDDQDDQLPPEVQKWVENAQKHTERFKKFQEQFEHFRKVQAEQNNRPATPPPSKAKRKYSFGSDDVSPDKPTVVRRRHIYNKFQVDPADIELDEDLQDECQPPLPYLSPTTAPRQALLDRLKRPVPTIDRRGPALPRVEQRGFLQDEQLSCDDEVTPEKKRPVYGPSANLIEIEAENYIYDNYDTIMEDIMERFNRLAQPPTRVQEREPISHQTPDELIEFVSPQREVRERMHDGSPPNSAGRRTSSPGMACAMAEEAHPAPVDNRLEIPQSSPQLDLSALAWDQTEKHYELVHRYEDFKKNKASPRPPRTPPKPRKYSFGSDDVSPDKPAVVGRRHIYNKFQVDPADIELDEDLEDECQPPLAPESPRLVPRQALIDALNLRPAQTINTSKTKTPEQNAISSSPPRSLGRNIHALPNVEDYAMLEDEEGSLVECDPPSPSRSRDQEEDNSCNLEQTLQGRIAAINRPPDRNLTPDQAGFKWLDNYKPYEQQVSRPQQPTTKAAPKPSTRAAQKSTGAVPKQGMKAAQKPILKAQKPTTKPAPKPLSIAGQSSKTRQPVLKEAQSQKSCAIIKSQPKTRTSQQQQLQQQESKATTQKVSRQSYPTKQVSRTNQASKKPTSGPINRGASTSGLTTASNTLNQRKSKVNATESEMSCKNKGGEQKPKKPTEKDSTTGKKPRR